MTFSLWSIISDADGVMNWATYAPDAARRGPDRPARRHAG